jgi:hypothetical protein
MEDEPEEEEGGIGSGVLAFFLGLLVPMFAAMLSLGQDDIATLIIVGGFASIILYSEAQLSLSSGVAFGIGLTMTSFAATDWLMVGVSVAAVMVSLARHGLGDLGRPAFDAENGSTEPVLSA